MSGFEVAGVVLGALLILISAVEWSKKGIARGIIFFRKRRYVEKLALALLSQRQHLSEIIKSILIRSGCKEVSRLEDDPIGYLKDDAIRDQVLDYLGEENFAAFSGLILHCRQIIKGVAMKTAGLVPTIHGPSDDLIRIIEENRDAKRKQMGLMPRVKLMFGAEELKEVTKELDETTNALFRLISLVSSNRQSLGLRASRSALRIAESLRRAHKSAPYLYCAIFHSWGGKCHEGHETRLFLEDRIYDRVASHRSVGGPLAFPLVFLTPPSEKKRVWHEAVIKVLGDDEDNGLTPSHIPVNQLPEASRRVTPTITGARRPPPQIMPVENICAVINSDRHIAFVLTRHHRIGMLGADDSGLTAPAQPTKTSLMELFSVHSGERRGASMPLRRRMLLALRLASNLLQLFQAHWLPNAWSHENVFFPVATAADQGSSPDIDFSRPFMSAPFTKYAKHTTQPQPQPKTEPKVALLELGILLLEIWHEETLEMHFSLGNPPTGYYERLAKAVEWLDDMSNPPPQLYIKAACHCIMGMIGGEVQLGRWDGNDFWNAVCGDIIEPLFKNCKMWR
ncbi:hypothetical protein MFIFM68171_06535 [Madurella fahalii]|uniref:DUF7580 domain-containing protein n=1 Tax=Madurella fahalii TaxID=1157608 RepID=A0ABQ0GEX6_9PEZI